MYGSGSKIACDLKEALMFLYSPIPTNVSREQWAAYGCGMSDEISFDPTLHGFIEFLKSDKDPSEKVQEAKKFKSKYGDTANGHLLTFLLTTKTLIPGVSAKFLKKLIKAEPFKVMLAEEIPIDKIETGREYSITEKIDGVNLTAFVTKDKISFYTRDGKEIKGLIKLEKAYAEMPKGVYFGEALYNSGTYGRTQRYRVTAQTLSIPGEKYCISHYIFDYMTLDAWIHPMLRKPFVYNRDFLNTYQYSVQEPLVIIPEMCRGSSRYMIEKTFKLALKTGSEGIVVRYLDSVYENRRSKSMIKIKKYETLDLRVISLIPSKKDGRVDGVIVESSTGTPVYVRNGVTREDKKLFYENPEKVIDKIAIIQCKGVLYDDLGKTATLRSPVFIGIRYDKTEPSY